MATLYITEYSALARDAGGQSTVVAKEPAVTTQTVTYTTTTASAAFNAETAYVRIVSSADGHILFGATPVATASTTPVAAKVDYWFGVIAGQKVAACNDAI